MYSRFELTLKELLEEDIYDWFDGNINKYGWGSSLAHSGRILVIEGPEDIDELIVALGDYGFAQEVAHIREVIDYELDIVSDDDLHILVEFE